MTAIDEDTTTGATTTIAGEAAIRSRSLGAGMAITAGAEVTSTMFSSYLFVFGCLRFHFFVWIEFVIYSIKMSNERVILTC